MLNLEEIDCTGCGACFNVCPHQAIEMSAEEDGFFYPKIDKALCVDCDLCRKVCPVSHPDYNANPKPACYAAMADDAIRFKSSSGGIFPLLAEHILSRGGYVCGAAYNQDWAVEHIIISSIDELHRLKGSKYVQSSTGNCYLRIKELLKKGAEVLFSGTPCQVAGLKAYLNKKYDNLLTVDIICHGTPSPKVYKKYLEELHLDGTLNEINFRDKCKGWSNDLIFTITTDKETHSTAAAKDVYMQAFLKNLCLRKSCGNCQFNKIPRQGDLTIGDFWGINRCNPDYNDKKGTSAILENTSKGHQVLAEIKNKFKLFKKVDLKYAIYGNHTLNGSSPIHKNRNQFFKDLDSMSLQENLDNCLQDKCDVVIMNFWWSLNYGAILTTYALQQTLKQWGYRSRLANYIADWCRERFVGSFSEKFAEKYFDLTVPMQSSEDLNEINKITNTIIVGSDQVLRQKYNRGLGNCFYLPFATADKKKIACAASFGVDYLEGSEDEKAMLRYYLSRFDAVSVRENSGVDICRKEFGREAEHILDPVFWLEQKYWEDLILQSKNAEKDFGLIYVLDKTEKVQEMLQQVIAIQEDAKIVDMANAQNKHEVVTQSPEDWLYNIQNCRYMVTDSFHGACFAIIFRKPFICLANAERGASRFESLFSMLGLNSQLLTSDENTVIRPDLWKDIDYDSVMAKLQAEVEHSQQWLKQALQISKNNSSAESEIVRYLLKQINEQSVEICDLRNELCCSNLSKLKLRYWRYKILSKICWGNARKKYKNKKKDCKQKLKDLKKYRKKRS